MLLPLAFFLFGLKPLFLGVFLHFTLHALLVIAGTSLFLFLLSLFPLGLFLKCRLGMWAVKTPTYRFTLGLCLSLSL